MVKLPRRVIRTIVEVLGGIVLFLSLEVWLNGLLQTYKILFIAGGLTLIIFSRKITKIDNNITQTLGAIIVFLGAKQYIKQYIGTYTIWFFIGALLILVLSDNIVEMIDRI